jgi:NAD(P)-dependent dehydrogenase (short-subunit alcohol dehydrogenase family)
MSSPKVWLITGASRGFGRRWTEAALARGDKVAATARDLKSLEILQQQYGDALLPLVLDFGDPSATGEAILKVVDAFRPASSSYPRQYNAAVDQKSLRGAPSDLGKLGRCFEGCARPQNRSNKLN